MTITTAEQFAALQVANRATTQLLRELEAFASPGMTTRELDDYARAYIANLGGEPVFETQAGFPGAINTNPNDVVVHGIPGRYRLAAGDLVSVDCGARYRGWSGDAALSFVVGEHPDPRVTRRDEALIATTRAALDAGIAAARPGARLGDVAHAIGRVARAAGYGLLAHHGGHGIGREMHEAPHVPNEGRPGRGLVLRPGLVLALEPMLISGGTDAYVEDPDGWTLRTADGTRAAHVEHTVAVTESGPEVLTQLAMAMR